MIPGKNRLTTKDVKYINRQKKTFFTKNFAFSAISQYPNRKYNQISLHIPRKLTKFASKRHFIKRRLIHYLQKRLNLNQNIKNWFYKIFINFNKKTLEIKKSYLEEHWKYNFTEKILKDFERDLNFYISHI